MSPRSTLALAALALAATACSGQTPGLPQHWTADELAPTLPAAPPADEAEADTEGAAPVAFESPSVIAAATRHIGFVAPVAEVEAPGAGPSRPWIATAPKDETPPVDTSAPPAFAGLDEGEICTFTATMFGDACLTDLGAAPCIIRSNFDSILGTEGLVVGGTKSLHLTSAAALERALPGLSAAAPLSSDQRDPWATEMNTFASEVVALGLNIALSEHGFGGSRSLASVRLAHGPLAGLSVGQLFDMSQDLLGGDANTLGALGFTAQDLVPILDIINRAGVDCRATAMLTR